MRLFDHIGCKSGQCIWQQWGLTTLSADDISDVKNHLEEKARARELLNRARELQNEARRLSDEQDTHTEFGAGAPCGGV